MNNFVTFTEFRNLNAVIILLFSSVVLFAQSARIGGPHSSHDRCDFSKYAAVPIEYYAKDAVERKVVPKYPVAAAKQRVGSNVSVKILIDERGHIVRACATFGNKLFFKNAEAAAKLWRFKPKYGLAFSSAPEGRKRKRYASAFIVFEFKPPEDRN